MILLPMQKWSKFFSASFCHSKWRSNMTNLVLSQCFIPLILSNVTGVKRQILCSVVCFIFFPPHMSYARKIIHSVGLFFLFSQTTKSFNSFYSKMNDSSRVRTTGSSSSKSGFRVSVVPNLFMISLTCVKVSNGSYGRMVRTTGFWCGKYGFESQPSSTF